MVRLFPILLKCVKRRILAKERDGHIVCLAVLAISCQVQLIKVLMDLLLS